MSVGAQFSSSPLPTQLPAAPVRKPCAVSRAPTASSAMDGATRGLHEAFAVTIWNSTASLQLGRARPNDKWVDPFAGDVDDVRIFAGVLDPADINDLWFTSRPPAA